ncbi:uncharacterized protein LOC119573453, partial [Penaeus monodon]|uniref:uncharacterized protein LOC119573453 n=1 Tax=Penaeus monodon TaxID=6687 RepID=UPI0018A702D5
MSLFNGIAGRRRSDYDPVDKKARGVARGLGASAQPGGGGGNLTADSEREATFASAFDFKFETTDHVDNTAGNAVKLYCSDHVGHIVDILSTQGKKYGRGAGARACAQGYIT